MCVQTHAFATCVRGEVFCKIAEVFSWDDMRYLLALHRTGTLSAAARSLRVAQTTVGRRLVALEAALDARLFDRTRDGFRLNAAGRTIMPTAERMERDALTLVARVGGRDSRAEGRVRITAPEVLGSRLVTPRLTELYAVHPGLEVELLADNRVYDFGRREADLAIRLAPPREGHLAARRLGELAYGLFASPQYLAARGRPDDGVLDGHDLIVSSVPYDTTPDQRWLRARAAGARSSFRSTSILAMLEAARAGLGIAMLPCWLAAMEPSLQEIWPEAHTRREVWLVIRKDVRRHARTRVVADFVVALFAAWRAGREVGTHPAGARG